MKNKLIPFFFFSNYFIGLLAIALSVETVFQLRLPVNSVAFYIMLFSATVVFYTMAYIPSRKKTAANPRAIWYRNHACYIKISQVILMAICAAAAFWQIIRIPQLPVLPAWQWILLFSIPVAACLYYGLWTKVPKLRTIGWLKPFLIGYVWAGTVGLLPVSILIVENKTPAIQGGFIFWLLLKNWMFCAVNAIIFDIKDYADDANQEIKTFVVRVGLRKTIFLVVIPLLMIGFFSFLLFALHHRFHMVTILLNAIPFLLLCYIAFTMQQRKNILYYLIVIDGVLLVKSLCGITAALLSV